MRPRPFRAETLSPSYVRDIRDGHVWHRCELRILYADTDRSQVVYHANYLKYFEFGRASLMREAGYPYKQIEEEGYIYPIIKTELNYYAPLYYDDLIHIHTRPGRIELVRLQFEYLITREDGREVVCTGYTRHCAVNSRGIPVEVDEKTVRLWQGFPHL